MIETIKILLKNQDLLFFVQFFWHFLLCFCFDLAVSTRSELLRGVFFPALVRSLFTTVVSMGLHIFEEFHNISYERNSIAFYVR